MAALSTDVERALQHAIGQANRPFATGLPDTNVGQRKKGKKRAREDAADGGEHVTKEEKKRKRKHVHELGNTADTTDGFNIDPTMLEHGGPAPEVVKKKKKSKNQKHADPGSSAIDLPTLVAHASPPPSQGQSTPTQATASTSAFASTKSQLESSHYPPHELLSSNPGENSFTQLNNNDDILRAFQDLDLTRLAGVLRGLDLPGSPSPSNLDLTMLLGSNDLQFDQGASSTMANSTTSNASASTSSIQGRKWASNAIIRTQSSRPERTQNPNLPAIGPSIANADHTDMLATKWLSTSKLKELVETEGLVYKKGKFSAMEEQSLRAAIENYRVRHGLQPDDVTAVIFSKSKKDVTLFWSEITASLPARPIIAVYHHVRRAYHPLKAQGKWIKDEDIALIKAVTDLGQAWQKVSERVGRTAQDCRDRWRNHMAHRSERQTGHWSKEEEAELTGIVKELTTDRGKDSDTDIFWGIVSQRMGNKRGRQQCRIKWTDTLNKSVKNAGQTPRWGKLDAFILVHKVASLDIQDDSEIDWKLLPDPDWNLWSAHLLQRRWRSLKHSIKGHEEMAFRDIIEILKQKNADSPRVDDGTLNRKEYRKEPKSSVVIEDGDGKKGDDSDPESDGG